MTPSRDCDNSLALLAQISRFIHVRGRETLDALGLQRGQPHILHILWENEGLTQTQLAERVMISPPSMSHALQRMEEAGYVERRPDPADDRALHVYLTESGRALREPLDKGWRQLEQAVFAVLSDEEQATLQGLLRRVRDNLAPGGCGGPCRSDRQADDTQEASPAPSTAAQPQEQS